ncbi:hypothetical protein [Tardiphaga sp. 42S5]|uniref:hypothetical protein n=1 Tax=Tardiphaga sp. 42S5 TaxID=1404799 RepID=UPI002A59DA55|nr:hypothetical protein [Tardiphaga sp. 42S5]WPO42727.1 hypothetical protein SFY93_06130 [Tardiphaga sp. 42S5]
MTEGAPAIFMAMEASAIGSAIRQSRWLYMSANIGHIVALMFFAGAIAVMDVRLAGGLAATAPGPLLRRARRFAIAGFLGLVLTGGILFTAEASHVVLNRVFQIKAALIALGLLNVVWVEAIIMPRIVALPPLSPMPAGARQGALASIAIWFAVAICGRAIAYF